MRKLWLLLCLVAANAAAQSFPTKPVRWIVPFPPGGATDIIARIVAQKMSEAWAQPVVVEPAPVIVQPAPVVVYPPWMVVQQGAPVYQAAPAVPTHSASSAAVTINAPHTARGLFSTRASLARPAQSM